MKYMIKIQWSYNFKDATQESGNIYKENAQMLCYHKFKVKWAKRPTDHKTLEH